MDQARLTGVTARADFEFPPFAPRAPWWGADLQTLSNYFRPRFGLGRLPAERFILPLADRSGDSLAASFSTPAPDGPRRPVAVLIHGLGGNERSAYIRRTALYLLALGYPVLRLNLRGAGPSRPHCRTQYHAGRSGDFDLALKALPRAVTDSGIVAIGFSLGGNMLLKFLGEREAAAPLLAAVSISAPIDLAATAQRMMHRRNSFYQAYVMRAIRREAVAPASVLTPKEQRAILGVRSLREFDETFTAPRNGFAGAADYYAKSSAVSFLPAVAVPTLVIHALDDPWVPSAPYRQFEWQCNPHLVPLLPRHGGHVGFQGDDRRAAWHDRAIAHFLAAVLSPL